MEQSKYLKRISEINKKNLDEGNTDNSRGI